MGNLSFVGLDAVKQGVALAEGIRDLPEEERILVLNEIRLALHQVSPFREEPVDCVLWVPNGTVEANDYNPNIVAPPEMRLLTHSVKEDGFTQPIVTWLDKENHGRREVVDGFHRSRVGRESRVIKKRIMGYLPVTTINVDRESKSDRMGSTIRHNRARGKHTVDGMSELVVDLARRNWSDAKIAQELGMEPDEVLRLKQISGLAEMFADKEFSEAWEVDL
jgi:ParB-like chromosome segregation protein Spo0J